MCVSRWHDGPAKILVPINADPDQDQCWNVIRLTKISVGKQMSTQKNLLLYYNALLLLLYDAGAALVEN